MPKPHDIIAIVGQITPQIASQIKRQAGDIVLEVGNDRFGLVHIEERHAKEIQSIGINTTDFVKIVGEGYNEIRAVAKGKLWLIKKNGTAKVAVLELKPFDNNADKWSIVTAFPVAYKRVEKKKLLWVRAAPEPNDMANIENNLTSIGRITKPKPILQAAIIQSNTKITKNHTQAMTTKRKPLATKQKKGLSGVKVAMIVLQAKKVKETEGVYKGFLKTVFYNNGKLIATIPAYQTQPRKSQKTITLNSFKYALNWSKQ